VAKRELQSGGGEWHVVALAHGLDAGGFRHHVISCRSVAVGRARLWPDGQNARGERRADDYGDATLLAEGWIPVRSATVSSKPDLNVFSKLGKHGFDGCFEG